jgi:ABC-type glycerol-3-phosphate transport system substrate-binding protein
MKTTQKLAGGVVALLVVAILALGANSYLRRTGLLPAPPTQAAAISDQNPSGIEPAPDDANPVITFGTYEFYKDGYKPLVEQFQKEHPEITVQLVTLNDYNDPRQVASAADTMMLPEMMGSDNYYLDLTPFQEGQRDFDGDDFWPGVFESCQDVDGRQYGLPAEVTRSASSTTKKPSKKPGLPIPPPAGPGMISVALPPR